MSMSRADVDQILATTTTICTIQRQPVVGSDAYGEDTLGDWAAIYTGIACAYQSPAPRARRVTPEAALTSDEKHVYVAGEYAVLEGDRVVNVQATLPLGAVATLNRAPLAVIDVVDDTGLMKQLVCREIV